MKNGVGSTFSSLPFSTPKSHFSCKSNVLAKGKVSDLGLKLRHSVIVDMCVLYSANLFHHEPSVYEHTNADL